MGNLQTHGANSLKKKKSKGVTLNTKLESIDLDTDSEIDYALVVNFAKRYKRIILMIFFLMIQLPLTRKKLILKIKIQANNVEIKMIKKNSIDKPSGVQGYECSGFGHYAYEYGNQKKKIGKVMQTI